ncbi:NADP-dependent isocitrate dehydrogenase [Desulfotignum phosphitoxidans]|uniref:isocitrate dehydrogenase (NADP(+)) n=1 Tax=Desulfotignum phosphitoxidans DSM 13687 TaxID=1286635 RepID=S0G5P3_9BACT|nr:NADP-dependent isocitrate dehydrogenase [Desulfotignum phosphitoxidans]EMS79872.1 isocitrate dehydrogenase [NADP] [Desulfotignum phosphitoxidans DSM 13687]
MQQPISITSNGTWQVPDYPSVACIKGDGIGSDIWPNARIVLDAAVNAVFGEEKKIDWVPVPAGAASFKETGHWLPDQTLETIRNLKVAIKGPLATPVGKGIRSLNVRLRKELDLYACIRPVKYYPPVPSPVKHPEKVDMVVFRENTEDVYAGMEWEAGTPECRQLMHMLKTRLNCNLPESSALGLKPMSPENTRRLVKKACEYALENNRKSVTLMHKGNIMKFTEGGFRKWGYEAAFDCFGDRMITEDVLYARYEGVVPDGHVVVRDRIADMVFADVLLKPDQYDIIACPNLNGDYISDALAAQVGGLGMAPGANIGDACAVFEATHGTAPDIAGKDAANPCSLMLSGAMMLDHLGWHAAGDAVRRAVGRALAGGQVTSDLADQIPGAKAVSCSGFSRIVMENLFVTA